MAVNHLRQLANILLAGGDSVHFGGSKLMLRIFALFFEITGV